MNTTTVSYRSAPTMLCYAPAKAFPTAQEALRHASEAANAFRVGYAVYECLAGRPRRLQTFEPKHPTPEQESRNG